MKYVLIALILALTLGYTAVYTPDVDQSPVDIPDESETKMTIHVLTVEDESALVKDVETNSLYYLAHKETEAFGINMAVGQMLDVYWDGIVLTSYPGQFGGLHKVELIAERKATVETIVRDLLAHLRDERPEWFSDMEILSVDLSESRLTDMQQEAAMFVLASLPFAEDVRLLRFSRDELIEMGTITEGEPWHGRIVKIVKDDGNSYTLTVSSGEADDSEQVVVSVVWVDQRYHLTTKE